MKNRKIITDDTLFAGNVKFLRGIDDPGSTQMRNDIKAAADQVKTVAVRADVALAAVSEASQLSMVRLVLSATAITRSRMGAYSPAAILIKAQGMEGVSYYGRFRVDTSDDGTTYAASYASANDEAQYSYTLSTGSYIRVRLYQKGGLAILLQEAILVVTNDSGTAPIYWGALTTAPTAGVMLNDYYFDANDAGDGGGVMRYWNGTAWVEMTSAHALYQEAWWNALADAGDWATTQGSVVAAASAIFQKLVTADAFIANLFAQQITVPTGGRIRYYNGQGVQKRCVQLADDRIDWLDTPDTDPPTAELLAAIIGRLGVNGPAILDGDWQANIESEWSQESVINAAASSTPVYILRSSGERRIAYQRGSDNYLVERVWSGSAWGTESVITPASAVFPFYIELSDESLHVIYQRNSDFYIVERGWNGSSWGSESVINSASSSAPCGIQRNSGEYRVAYTRNADNYICERVWSGSVWGAESVINNASSQYVNLVESTGGELRAAYRRASDGYLVERIWSGTAWGSESIINGASSYQPRLIATIDGMFRAAYIGTSLDVVERIWNGSSWGDESIIDSGTNDTPTYHQLYDGSLSVAYRRSDTYLVERTLQRYARIGAGIIAEGGDATGGYWEKWGNGKLVQWGWGYIAWSSGQASMSEDVELPEEFVSLDYYPDADCIGYKSTDPSSQYDLTGDAPHMAASARIVDGNTIRITLSYTPGTGAATTSRFIYKWNAEGRWK